MDIWYGSTDQEIVKTNKNYTLQLQMFPAQSAEEAFNKARVMLEGFGDSNHDGDGDLYIEKGIGIYQLELVCDFSDFNEKINDLYGLECGLVEASDLSNSENPRIREKLELEVFR